VLAILGEEDEYSTPAQIEAILTHAANSPGVEFLKLADCRHSAQRDQPEMVLASLLRFIDDVGE